MIEKIPTLAQLCKVLQQVPYLASKNLYRVATHFLTSDQEKVERFCLALLEAKRNITLCLCVVFGKSAINSVCFAMTLSVIMRLFVW